MVSGALGVRHLPTISPAPVPSIGRWTSAQFWFSFLLRHYAYGPEAGLYGPPRHRAFLERVERRMAERSAASAPGRTHEIPSVDADAIGPAEFQATYLEPNTPVVLRGMARAWPAVREWDLAFFRRRYGDQRVPVRPRGSGIGAGDLRYVETSVAELVDHIEGGGEGFGGHMEDLWLRNPELRGAVDLDALRAHLCRRRVLFDRRLSRIASLQLFVSGAGTRSGFHCAGGPNLFVMVRGRKVWTMVDPRFSKWMHPATRRDMFYAASPIDWRRTDEEISADGFPLYAFAPRYTATLEAGDVLFSPQWWWHAVETTEPSIGVATRTINRFFAGHAIFSAMWVLSPAFRRVVLQVLRTGWGSDDTSGARVAFEAQ